MLALEPVAVDLAPNVDDVALLEAQLPAGDCAGGKRVG